MASISFKMIPTKRFVKRIRFSPGNRTLRVNSSAIMQPTDHMSTESDHNIMLQHKRQPHQKTRESILKYIHRVWKKGATIHLPLTLPNDEQFSKFFHRQT